MKVKLQILLGLFLIVSTAFSQSKKDYEKAENLAKEANQHLLNGDVNLADSLINASIKIYPTSEVLNYAETVAQLPDVLKANMVMFKMLDKLKGLGSKVLNSAPTSSKIENGLLVQSNFKIREDNAVDVLHTLGFKAYTLNKTFGKKSDMIRSLQYILDIENLSAGGHISQNYHQAALIHLYSLQGEYEKALELTEKTNKMASLGPLIDNGEYDAALEIAATFGPYGDTFVFIINALKGDNDQALKYYNKIDKSIRDVPENIYYLALIDINKTDYQAAIDKLNSISLGRRKASQSQVQSWKLFTALGKAYAGMKDYEKARDNYNIALLYDPSHQPAIEGLSKLEVKYATETAADKTPPQITITEPLLARGLKVTPAKEKVMVRGVAKDPSGLKEVSLNGKIIYSQQGGDFWGEVNLAAGLNKIEVVATDMAGNKAVQQFEIQKADQPIAQSDIISVVETEGKNYALFVAAQNYADSAIPSLENPVADAVKLKLILKNNYNFADANIVSLFNPESNDLRRQLLELTNILQPEDKLVIFYAGHGIWVDKEKKGYWLLTDAKRNDTNTWLPNRDVLDLIAKIPARHTLLITDACFSGSVFKTRGLGEGAPVALQEMDNKISRVAITSGNDTEVPDESVFMKYLMKALSENKEKYLTAQKMFINQIIEAVMTESKTEPRYGTLESAGHVGGDFIFSRK